MSSSETVDCPFCEAEIGAQAKKCRYCGEWVARSCERCGTPVRGEWAARGECEECRRRRGVPVVQQVPTAVVPTKSRGVAVATAMLFGGFGFHRFYLGNPLAGIVYLIFCWTLIPSLIGFIEGINYAVMGEAEFQRRYST